MNAPTPIVHSSVRGRIDCGVCGGTTKALSTSCRSSHLSSNNASPTKTRECYRYGGKHSASTCRFREAECFVCGEKGHLARMCAHRREWSRTKEDTQEHWLAVHKELEDDRATWGVWHVLDGDFTSWRDLIV